MNQITRQPSTSLSLSSQLCEAIGRRPIVAHDREAAALFTLDAIANIIAGRNSVQGRKLLAWYRNMSGTHNTAPDASRLSFIYGALCHILEVDDLHRASVVHPGCVVVPAVMAMGQGTSGHAALNAIIRGFEATCRVGMSVGSEHYKIWHNTATCGPFGSAMATASLLGLNLDQTVHAMGNAGSQSAGLWQFLDTGAETKHMHAGRGAEAGVVAATLAQHGFTGAPDILEGERGFYKATCPNPRPELLVPSASDLWQVHMTSIKPWPSCRHTHPAIDCALSLHDQVPDIEDITSIEVAAYPAALHLCDRTVVDTAYAGKFSLQHCTAAAIGDGAVTFASFEPDARDRLKALRDKVKVATDDNYTATYPAHWGSRVSINLKNGKTLVRDVNDARGDPELPLSREDMIAKSKGLLLHGGHEQPHQVIDDILGLVDDRPMPDFSGILNT